MVEIVYHEWYAITMKQWYVITLDVEFQQWRCYKPAMAKISFACGYVGTIGWENT